MLLCEEQNGDVSFSKCFHFFTTLCHKTHLVNVTFLHCSHKNCVTSPGSAAWGLTKQHTRNVFGRSCWKHCLNSWKFFTSINNFCIFIFSTFSWKVSHIKFTTIAWILVHFVYIFLLFFIHRPADVSPAILHDIYSVTNYKKGQTVLLLAYSPVVSA